MDKNFRLGFIGVGNMGSAIVAGVLKNELLPPQNIVVTDIDKQRVASLHEQFGVIAADGIDELLGRVDAALYAAKPQDVPKIFPLLSMSPNQWLISIAAGVKTGTLEEYLPENTPVVRVMPSITASVGAGAAAICGGKHATDEHIGITQETFTSVGKAIVMEEKLLDAVTGLSGSGPAFVFLFIEALADAGVQVGLSRQDATVLAIQTALGASKMVEQTGEHPAILKNRE
ncbi:TPA: pyrroline-5-carboxylate reductase, partial [Candidatus Poribacteria bacterium]|nr:pyrroline-5-carboxylate reductase [Candidatus Poribacteria bacterium]